MHSNRMQTVTQSIQNGLITHITLTKLVRYTALIRCFIKRFSIARLSEIAINLSIYLT